MHVPTLATNHEVRRLVLEFGHYGYCRIVFRGRGGETRDLGRDKLDDETWDLVVPKSV